MFKFLEDEICHTVIINHFEKNLSEKKSIIQTIKRISPYTQIIVNITDIKSSQIFVLLKIDLIDKLIISGSDIDLYFKVIKQTVNKSRNIRQLSDLRNYYDFYFSRNKTEIVKTFLLNDTTKVNNMSLPEFLGILILKYQKQIYSKF